MNIIGAMEGPFAPWFPGSSWTAWKAVSKAAFALRMTKRERAIFGELAGGREPPSKRVKELVIVAGRRSGKDSVASAIVAWAAGIEQAHIGLLRPGERATVMLLARDREQSKIIKNYVDAFFQTIPELSEQVVRETATGLELANGVEIVISTNDYRAIRGRTVLVAILDECAFYADENSASPDIETDRALDPAMATLPSSLKVIISSPHKKGGLLFEKYRASYGKDDDRTLVIQAATPKLNPTIDPAIIARDMERDPEAAKAEWGGIFRDDVTSAFPPELIEAAVDPGVVVRPPRPGFEYRAYADAASGTGRDSYAAAIAHLDGDEVVLDALYEARPPFNPQNITADVAGLLREYGLSACMGDRYAAGYNVEAFARCGVSYVYSERGTSANYLESLPLFASGRVRLLDNRRMVSQFTGLERRTVRGGQDKIDHGSGDRHDDLSAAVAGVLSLVAMDKRPALARQSDLLVNGAPVPVPTARIVGIAAIFVTDARGMGAVIYAAVHRPGMSPPLFVLDYDDDPPRSGVFAQIGDRVRALAQECNAATGFVWLPERLRMQAEDQGLLSEGIPPDFRAEDELFGVGQHISAGSVKICGPAHERSKSSPLGGALELRSGEPVEDALRLALVALVSLSLGSTGGGRRWVQ